MNNYYTLPFDTKTLLEKRKHARCGIKDSVQMNMHLIIRTHFKEYRYDSNYGCLIWNKDYSTVTNVSHWKDELKELMISAIEKYETRISKLKINLNLEDAEFSDQLKKQPLKFKKKITIQVLGTIALLNEPFEHFEYLFFSPLSIA